MIVLSKRSLTVKAPKNALERLGKLYNGHKIKRKLDTIKRLWAQGSRRLKGWGQGLVLIFSCFKITFRILIHSI